MASLEKGSLRRLLTTGGISEREFQAIKPGIYKNNISTFTVIAAVALVIGIVLFFFSFVYEEIHGNFPGYAALSIVSALLLIWSQLAKRGVVAGVALPFVALAAGFAYGIYLGVGNYANMASVTFMVLLVALPLLVVDRPYKVILLIIVAALAMIAATLFFKEGAACTLDIIDTVCFSVLSIFANVILTRSQINEVLLHAQAEKSRRIDALTGLRNANAYHDAIDKLDAQTSQGEDVKYGVIVADVNYLKRTNDNYGHSAGDELIRAAGKLLCDTFVHSPVMRIGGDEFVVILRGHDYEHRMELLKTLKQEMETRTFDHDGKIHGISIAYGLGEYSAEKEMHYADVFHDADGAMYACKAAMKACRE